MHKSPGFAAAVLTLALSIGANTVVFSIMNAFIVRRLNVPHAESLYGLWRQPANNMAESYPDYLDLRDRNHSFDALVAFNAAEIGLDTGEGPSRAWAEELPGTTLTHWACSRIVAISSAPPISMALTVLLGGSLGNPGAMKGSGAQ